MATTVNHRSDGQEPVPAYRALAAAHLQRVFTHEETHPLLSHWVAAGRLQHAPRGAVIHRHGDRYEGLLLIVTGVIAVGRGLEGDNAHVHALLGAGDLHGVEPLTDGGPHPHDLRAHEDAVLLTISTALVLASIRHHPCLGDTLMRLMALQTRQLYDRLCDVLTQPLSHRVARQLLQFARRFGAPRPEGLLLTVRLTQADLAAMLGAGRQQVNTELKKLAQRGCIRVSRTTISVLDLEALADVAGDPTSPSLSMSAPLRGAHVLLVDDDAVYRLLVSTWLQQAGAHVEEVDNGALAVDRVCHTALAYDVILMDDKMPQLSGSEATRRIREHEAARGHKSTPILCISSASTRRDTERYQAAGMTGFICKPSEPGPLLQALHPLLS